MQAAGFAANHLQVEGLTLRAPPEPSISMHMVNCIQIASHFIEQPSSLSIRHLGIDSGASFFSNTGEHGQLQGMRTQHYVLT